MHNVKVKKDHFLPSILNLSVFQNVEVKTFLQIQAITRIFEKHLGLILLELILL